MADVERLAVLIEANTKSYENAMAKVEQRTQQALARVEQQYKTSGDRVDSFLSKIGSRLFAGGLVAAGAKAVSMFKSMVTELGHIADMAERAGVSTDFVQALGFQVEQSGGSMEDAARAAAKFGKELGDVNVQQSYLGRLLAANGVDIKKFGGDGAAAFEAFAKVVANASKTTDAQNMVMNVLGDKVGPKMMATLKEIASIGLPAFIQKMKEAGVVLDESIIKKGDQIDDKWNEMLKSMGNSFKTFIVNTVKEWGLLIDTLRKEPEVPAIDAANAVKNLPALRAELAELEKLAQGVSGAATSAISSKMYDGRIAYLRELIAAADAAISNRPRVTVTKGAPSKNVSTTFKDDDFKNRINQIEDEIERMERETQVIDQTTAAREAATVALKLEQAARQANAEAGKTDVTVTAEQRAEIDRVTEAYGRMAVAVENAKGPLRSFAREGANINLQMQDAVVNGLKGFEDALIGIVQGTKNAKEAFRDMANAIIADLLRIMIRSQITGPLAGALGSFFGGGSSGAATVPLPPVRPGNLAMPGGGGQEGMVVVNHFEGAGGDKNKVQTRRGSRGETIVDMLTRAVNGEMADGKFDGSLGGRFGARPVPVMR